MGIKSILSPPKQQSQDVNDSVAPEKQNNEFTIDQLDYAWKEYALKVKREKKNSLFSTLNGAKPKLASDYSINITVKSTIEANDIDKEKPELIGFLRQKLGNSNLTVNYSVIESQKASFVDNKSVFEDLIKENESLNKFRKMFNLDIDF